VGSSQKVVIKGASGNLIFSERAVGNGAKVHFGEDNYGMDLFLSGNPSDGLNEKNILSLNFKTNSRYINSLMTYSGGRGSAAIKIAGVFTGASGGFEGIHSVIDADIDFMDTGHGVIGMKSIVRSTGVAVTRGVMYGAQFIAKKAGAGIATAEVSFIGVEGWFYETDSSEVRTGIGGNFGYHADSSKTPHAAGSVWRGVQIFCDNGGTSNAEESTGLCLWNMAGLVNNAINITQSGTGFTNFLYLASASKPPYTAKVTAVASLGNTLGYLLVSLAGTPGRIPIFGEWS
jgi:hypothetical protein